MGQVRERLYSDAKNDKIVETILIDVEKNNDDNNKGQKAHKITVLDYPKKKTKFDDII